MTKDRVSQIAAELEAMAEEDQRMRREFADGTREWDAEIDRRNSDRLKQILAEFGWPRRSLFGKVAAHRAWLLAQHASDLEFQRHCLNLMNQLGVGEVEARNVAYLEDRVRMREGRPQLYGTQFTSRDGGLRPGRSARTAEART